MVYTYTAVFSRAADGYSIFARIPDIKGCIATGLDLQETTAQITDALMGFLLVYEDDNMPIPQPTAPAAIARADEDIVSPITVDTTDYRQRLKNGNN